MIAKRGPGMESLMASMDTGGQAVPGSLGFALVCMIAGVLVVLGILAMVVETPDPVQTTPVSVTEGHVPSIVDLNADRESMLPRSPPGAIIDFSPRAPMFEAD